MRDPIRPREQGLTSPAHMAGHSPFSSDGIQCSYRPHTKQAAESLPKHLPLPAAVLYYSRRPLAFRAFASVTHFRDQSTSRRYPTSTFIFDIPSIMLGPHSPEAEKVYRRATDFQVNQAHIRKTNIRRLAYLICLQRGIYLEISTALREICHGNWLGMTFSQYGTLKMGGSAGFAFDVDDRNSGGNHCERLTTLLDTL